MTCISTSLSYPNFSHDCKGAGTSCKILSDNQILHGFLSYNLLFIVSTALTIMFAVRPPLGSAGVPLSPKVSDFHHGSFFGAFWLSTSATALPKPPTLCCFTGYRSWSLSVQRSALRQSVWWCAYLLSIPFSFRISAAFSGLHHDTGSQSSNAVSFRITFPFNLEVQRICIYLTAILPRRT